MAAAAVVDRAVGRRGLVDLDMTLSSIFPSFPWGSLADGKPRLPVGPEGCSVPSARRGAADPATDAEGHFVGETVLVVAALEGLMSVEEEAEEEERVWTEGESA